MLVTTFFQLVSDTQSYKIDIKTYLNQSTQHVYNKALIKRDNESKPILDNWMLSYNLFDLAAGHKKHKLYAVNL